MEFWLHVLVIDVWISHMFMERRSDSLDWQGRDVRQESIRKMAVAAGFCGENGWDG